MSREDLQEEMLLEECPNEEVSSEVLRLEGICGRNFFA